MFNNDCNFVSESAKAIRSSTFPTKANSLCSGVSVDMMADVSNFEAGFLVDGAIYESSTAIFLNKVRE